MLKTYTLNLTGRDAGTALRLTELPALVADRAARAALRAVGESEDGGVITLVFKHLKQVRDLGERGLRLLSPFVDARLPDGTALDLGATGAHGVRDWRNIEKIQQQALYLHTGFIIERESVDIPVAMVGDHILHGSTEARVTFCSPLLAAVLESKLATYHELETVLSTEDCFNLQEVNNVRAIRNWHESQKAPP
ncbi:hypothetical protein [uncultured Bradyrhizobium sp.]|nr:hypothetical protein [uncultured Bradyrhizobium sp.]